jgi:hypothetical protein
MTLAHNDYPHEPGTLYDCEACESMYYTIVFMDSGDEAWEVLDMGTTGEMLDYLSQWDFGEESEHTPRQTPWGSMDETHESGDYVLAWNRGLGYVSLQRRVMPR